MARASQSAAVGAHGFCYDCDYGEVRAGAGAGVGAGFDAPGRTD